jgi:hypothetical protein
MAGDPTKKSCSGSGERPKQRAPLIEAAILAGHVGAPTCYAPARDPAMSPMLGAVILFAVMWVVIVYAGYRLYRWLFRLDRSVRDGKAPFDLGL